MTYRSKQEFSADKDLAAKYAAVASKSVVESTVELSSKQESVDSMVPEPHSEVSDPTYLWLRSGASPCYTSRHPFSFPLRNATCT